MSEKAVLINKDLNRRRKFKSYEIYRITLRSLCNNEHINFNIRQLCMLELSRFPKKASITSIRNHCLLSGRSRGILKKFRLSRIKFRELALKGDMPGIVKASW